jgi:hypothetical protein
MLYGNDVHFDFYICDHCQNKKSIVVRYGDNFTQVYIISIANRPTGADFLKRAYDLAKEFNLI